LDIRAKAQLLHVRAPGELPEPARIANLAAMTLAILEHAHRQELTVGANANGVGDKILASDHFVDERVTEHSRALLRRPDAQCAMSGLRSAESRDLLKLRRRQAQWHDFERARIGKQLALRLLGGCID